MLDVIHDISYLQFAHTNVVARNPRQVLWSRAGSYDPAVLDDLMKRRDLFETRSLILPISELPIHAATMRAYRSATDPRRLVRDLRPRRQRGRRHVKRE